MAPAAGSPLKKLVREIHRRSLWQVLGIYLVGSWIALQAASVLTQAAALPEWFPSLALGLLILGLPVVIATAFLQERGDPETVLVEADESGARPGLVSPPTPLASRLFTWRNAVLSGVAGLALWGALAAGWMLLATPPVSSVMRFGLVFGEGQQPTGEMRFTPDGTALVYIGRGMGGRGNSRPLLWLRRLGELESSPIPDTNAVESFAISPDGGEVAVVDYLTRSLRIVSLGGGEERTVVGPVDMVLDWAPDGTLYYIEWAEDPRIFEIPDTGGNPHVFSELGGGECLQTLRVLPDGSTGLLTVIRCTGSGDPDAIWAVDLRSAERQHLVAEGFSPQYSPTGHLLFFAASGGSAAPNEATLMAAPFRARSAELTGPAVPVAELPPNDETAFTVSSDGTVVYPTATAGAELVWVSRQGDATPVEPGWRFNPPGPGHGWSLSPDGERVALTNIVDGVWEIWIKDLPAGPLERLTFGNRYPRHPSWSPDGEFVTYLAWDSTAYGPWRKRADGAGAPERLLNDPTSLLQPSWSPNGEWMVLRTQSNDHESGGRDIVAFRPGVDRMAIPLVESDDFTEQAPAISPDGAWLAYSSDESGRHEVYVRPFPNLDAGRVRVSIEGGMRPIWARSGDELFFIDAQRRLTTARVVADPDFRVLDRAPLFTLGPEFIVSSPNNSYDVAPDGQRFLMARYSTSSAPTHILVQNLLDNL